MMQIPHLYNQKGSALVVALTILLVLTILGVSAMRGTALQDKMAGNALDSQIAFEAAEFALRQAEILLESQTLSEADYGPNGGTGGYFDFKGLNPEAWTIENNWNNNAVDANTYNGNVSRFPHFMIQKVDAKVNLEDSPGLGGGYGVDRFVGLNVFQVSARGYGISPNSRVMLQVYYRM
jgi:type IV pilus assembly protein PilX